MVEFTTQDLTSWVMVFFWPFVRIAAFVGTAPIFGESSIPRRARVGIALLITVAIAPVLDVHPDLPPFSYPGVWVIAREVLIGSALGLTMRLAFGVAQATGTFVGMQMGLGFASFYSAALGGNAMILGRILNTVAMLLFLAINGHLVLLALLVDTFQILPVGVGRLDGAGWALAAETGTLVFTAGLSLALPLIGTLLTINLAMGILNRASPQFSIFSVGFPMTLLAGVTVFMFLMPELGPWFRHLFAEFFERISNIMALLAG